MYEQTIDAPRELTLGPHRILSGLALVPLLLALGFVLFTTLKAPLKDDVAWLLYVAQQWLAGRQLYVDLVEVNPTLDERNATAQLGTELALSALGMKIL